MSEDGREPPQERVVLPMAPFAPDGVGGLGILARLRRNGFTAFPRRCLDEPVIRLRAAGRPLVVVSAPESVRRVLHDQAGDYRRLRAGQRVLGPIVGRGLLVSEGETWRRQRRAMAPAFTPRTVPAIAGHVTRCTETACCRLESAAEQTVDLLAELQRLSLDIAAVTMFSLQAADFGAEMRGMVTDYMATIGRPAPSDFLLPPGMPTWLALRRSRFRKRWKRLIAAIVAKRRGLGLADRPRDLFELMAAAQGSAADDLLADEVATMIVAGHETTALALFWSCLLLAHAPAWQDAVAAEAAALDQSPAGAAAALPRLTLTRAVVQEALRLYPPAFLTARQALRSNVVGGVTVPAGANVLIPFWIMHRNERFWPAAEVFDPRRFLGPGGADHPAYLPFGTGPHSCIGAQLAMTEAVLVLARLVRGSRLSLRANRAVLPVGTLSTRPDHAPEFLLRRR